MYIIAAFFLANVSYFLIKFGYLINNYKSYLSKILITSLISFMGSLPLVINNYFSLNFITPFLNVIFVPLVSIIIFPLAIITFIFKPLDRLLFTLTNLMEKMSTTASFFSLNLPFGHLNMIWIIIYFVLLFYVFKKVSKYQYHLISIIILLLVFFYHLNFFNPNLKIDVINVGQGDTILISLPYNKGNILIDCANVISYNGNNDYDLCESIIIPYLKANGIKKLDYVILTHGDYDHMGGMTTLIQKFKVEIVLFNNGDYNTLEKDLIKLLNKQKIYNQKH